MIRGDLVLWKTAPSANTPGAPSWPNKDLVGRVVSLCEWMNTSDEPTCGDQWVEVVWSNNESTRCFRRDLKVWL